MLAPEILITNQQRIERDPSSLLDAVIEFCNWCMIEAWLVRDEIQPDAWLIYHTSYYIAQVHNGGHGQFAGNSRMKPKVLDDIETGLDRLGLENLLAIFRRFREALESDTSLKQAVMNGGGFGDIPAVINEIDHAFFVSRDPERFYARAKRWLKDAPTVVALTPRELRARQAAIVASNVLLSRRQAAATRRPLRARATDAIARIWDRTGLDRPGETFLDRARRRVAARPNWAQELYDAEGPLVAAFTPAVQDGDQVRVDEILAAYRELHVRYQLDKTSRWPRDIRAYAYRLKYAGERLGRPELLEQAADAFGHAIVAGPPKDDYDPGSAWRYLGETLVELGRLDEMHVPGVREALDAFDNALAIDAAKPDKFGYRVRDILGRAEAHLVLATQDAGAGHLESARAALGEVLPLDRPEDRDHWRAVNAELIALSPPTDVPARERASALRGLNLSIDREVRNEGAGWSSPARLKRLRRLKAAIVDRVPPS